MDQVTLQLKERQTATFEVSRQPSGIRIEGSEVTAKVAAISPWQWRIEMGDHTFDAWVLDFDAENNTARLRIGSKTVVATLDPMKIRYLRLMGIDQSALRKVGDLKAPMPGLVRTLLVTVGQTVEVGESLVVLEAMKMENVLKAAASGVVAELPVEAGQAVEKGAVLVRFAG